MAIVISDQWRGKGLGKALLSRLATRARERRDPLLAVILAENEGSIDLFGELRPEDPCCGW